MRTLVSIGVALVVLSGASWAAEKPEDQAQPVAESWLKLVDEGKYEDSWDRSARLFKGAVTREQWRQAASGARAPLGKLVSRKLKSRKYAEQLPGAPDGKYVIIQYDSVFEHKRSAVETVTPMVDVDGMWRVSGYFVR